MDIQSKLKRFKFFIEDNESAILVDFLDSEEDFENYVVIDASIKKEDLYGNDSEPEWSTSLKKLDKKPKFLIIKNITECPIDEQKKFIPIIKDKEYSDFDVLKDTVIIILDKKYRRDLIDKELLSYLTII